MTWYRRQRAAAKNAGRKWKKTKGVPHSRDEQLKRKIKQLRDTTNPVTDKPYNRREIAQQLGLSWQTVDRIMRKVRDEEEAEKQSRPARRPYGSPWMRRSAGTETKPIKATDPITEGAYAADTAKEGTDPEAYGRVQHVDEENGVATLITPAGERTLPLDRLVSIDRANAPRHTSLVENRLGNPDPWAQMLGRA